MSWWKQLCEGSASTRIPEIVEQVNFGLSGWSEQAPTDGMRLWRAPDGSVLSLTTITGDALLESQSDTTLQAEARNLAKLNGGGLIEAGRAADRERAQIWLIYKRLKLPAYFYTGMLFVTAGEVWLSWTVVAGEQGTTGIREAVVTTELINSGELDLKRYKSSFAQDPYDKSFRGVDARVLRFMSDAEEYDSRFPDHPLSRVRCVLKELRKNTPRINKHD